jgi:hypothetical protein
MPKSKYDKYSKIIMELHSKGKKATEIAKFLNEKDKKINAEESGLRSYIKKNLEQANQKKDSKVVPATKEAKLPPPKPDPIKKDTKHLSSLIEEMEKKISIQKADAILQGKLLKNLDILKGEYESLLNKHKDVSDKYSILNETLHEIILQGKEDNNKARLRYLIAAGWILTMLFAMFAGYYIGRCYSRPAFHYILTLTGIPAGIFIGLAIGAVKKAITKKA